MDKLKTVPVRKKLTKFFPASVLETRQALFHSDTLLRIRLMGNDIWSVVHKSRIDDGTLLVQVSRETDDYFDVVIPGEILQGTRETRVSKSEPPTWVYRMIESRDL